MASTEDLSRQLREKIVELFVRVEHLDIFSDEMGLEVFGVICETIGRACRHLASGRKDQALEIARTLGRSVPHAFVLGQDRTELEDALEAVIVVLEAPDISAFH